MEESKNRRDYGRKSNTFKKTLSESGVRDLFLSQKIFFCDTGKRKGVVDTPDSDILKQRTLPIPSSIRSPHTGSH